MNNPLLLESLHSVSLCRFHCPKARLIHPANARRKNLGKIFNIHLFNNLLTMLSTPHLWFILGAFLIGFFLFWRVPTLAEKPSESSEVFPKVSVIIPARNEAHRISKLLESLQDQILTPYELIVVDDASQDKTALMAKQLSARVLTGQPLPEGWTGKNWACCQGAEAAQGDILVFLDADVWLTRDALAKIIYHLQQFNGLLSIQPFHVMHKAYEQLSAVFNLIVMLSTNAFTPLGRKLKPRSGFGPCIACRRTTYFTVGGHKAARTAILESIPLTSAFQKQGFPSHLFRGRGSVNFRMYPNGLRELIEGWSKGFGRGSVSLNLTTLFLVVSWIWACFSVFSGLIKSLLGSGLLLPLAIIFYLLYAAQLLWMLRRIGTFHPLTPLLYPIPLTFFFVVMLLSLFRIYLLRRVRWHGREISQTGKKS